MAHPKTRQVTRAVELPCVPMRYPLQRAQRERIHEYLRDLIAWQASLAKWPSIERAPDATPFVTVYGRGNLRGCFGSHEGSATERIARAFLRALEDSRYGSLRAEERNDVAVVVSYVHSARVIDPERVAEEIEPGTDGLAVVAEGSPPVVLLPQVARDSRLGARELLASLARKAGREDWRGATVLAIQTYEVVARSGEREMPRMEMRDRMDLAAEWLAGLVADDGEVTFAVDARKRERVARGKMHHGRAAVLVRALDLHGRHARIATRARAWLAKEIRAALRGRTVEAWPDDVPAIAGTLALAQMAGVEVGQPLAEIARAEAVRASPWHAAQVIVALDREAPEPLWRACVDDLAKHPWAPWTLLAARVRGDLQIRYRCARHVAGSIRLRGPHEGGCTATDVPETAITALAAEALDEVPGDAETVACDFARRFVSRSQLVTNRTPAPLDVALAHGAYPASPVTVDFLRCDVTAHALIALLPSRVI